MPIYEYFNVYAPFSGTLQGQNYYCGGGVHWIHPDGTTDPWWNPRDLAKAGGNDMYFYGSTNVKSIRISHEAVGCANCSSPYNDGVVVEFFKGLNATQYIGKMFFGHVANRTAPGVYNERIKKVGTTISDNCTGTCYQGDHVHVEHSGAYWAITGTCGSSITYGSTLIYRWRIIIG